MGGELFGVFCTVEVSTEVRPFFALPSVRRTIKNKWQSPYQEVPLDVSVSGENIEEDQTRKY